MAAPQPRLRPAAATASSAPSSTAADLSTLTMSSCTMERAEGAHLFNVALFNDPPVGFFMRSGTFDVGGLTWAVLFYPVGAQAAPAGQHHFSVYLQLMTPNVQVQVLFDLKLMDKCTGGLQSLFGFGDRGEWRRAVFSTPPTMLPPPHPPRCWGVPSWREFNLEEPTYIENDSLTIRCDLAVILPPRVSETKTLPQIQLPPPSLSMDLRGLLEEDDGKDVTVRVRGEAFPAHWTVLAARSPVLRQKLLDAVAATDEAGPPSPVEIAMDDEMELAVFKAMLHFIYTDELPPDAERRDDGGDQAEFVRRLLIAAEGCGIERLKGLCQTLLCRNLNKQKLNDTMEFARRHGCYMLWDACVAVLGKPQERPRGRGRF